MILNSMSLKNIRSYVEETIQFPRGTTLFEGDVGSGKTTILMAIEFALFGLGSQKGGALLRAGTKEGSVNLQFEVDSVNYEVFRSLAKSGRGVQQSECWVKTSEGVLKLSASEMKEKVLEILNFNEPSDPKAQSVIYRYAIFTPQEEMKAILWMRSDSRLQTLRKAFRIEGYRVAADNALGLNRLVKRKKLDLEAVTSDIEEWKEKRKEKRARAEACEKDLEQQKAYKKTLLEKLNSKKNEKKQLEKKREELSKAVGEAPLLEKRIADCQQNMDGLEIENGELQQKIHDLQPKIESQLLEKPTDKTEQELGDELQKLRNEENSISQKIGGIEQKIVDYNSVKKNKICPTCDRPADPKEFDQKVLEKTNQKTQLVKSLDKCRAQINIIEDLKKLLREYEKAQTELKNLTIQKEGYEERLGRNGDILKKLAEETQNALEKLKTARKDIEQMRKLEEQCKSLETEIQGLESTIKNIENGISSIETEIKMVKQELNELGQEITKREKMKTQADELGEYQIWLEDFFIPTIDSIEKHVMVSISQEFDHQFQKWFSLLIEDPSKDARVDEEFTPIIEQDGYEQNMAYLSGGEKTSLALAYRLALNNIVQKVSTGMKSNLLILDEPTDGFSKEQLFKIREILNEIKCPQVIMVSHERELESFADQIWNVEKVKGISKVT